MLAFSLWGKKSIPTFWGGGITYSSKIAEAKNIQLGMTLVTTEERKGSQVFEENGDVFLKLEKVKIISVSMLSRGFLTFLLGQLS